MNPMIKTPAAVCTRNCLKPSIMHCSYGEVARSGIKSRQQQIEYVGKITLKTLEYTKSKARVMTTNHSAWY